MYAETVFAIVYHFFTYFSSDRHRQMNTPQVQYMPSKVHTMLLLLKRIGNSSEKFIRFGYLFTKQLVCFLFGIFGTSFIVNTTCY